VSSDSGTIEDLKHGQNGIKDGDMSTVHQYNPQQIYYITIKNILNPDFEIYSCKTAITRPSLS